MRFIKQNMSAVIIFFLGLTFIAAGVWRGEGETVLRKAINICMECIGLG